MKNFKAFEMSSLEYVKNKTDLKLVFLLEQNITGNAEVWERLDNIGLAGMGIDKVNLVFIVLQYYCHNSSGKPCDPWVS